ncbi:LysE family translocator [Azospirillum rugosum]|uniref:Threonine/homoserine/homoserine lactone efflux protein n=1 Tax=Azospirillum rugosum TaxID=416170 RepID=A0ABS4SM12_9PROT|nr:LysE family transporter [Azospirillum rugosum]MBP2293589.1 threonine/homoserine/homoserine lactone efflux protein [Azospirillum rugosum]MDQ0529268.1 threonine/homoserine/homoserine lactone efflux protein [Azospirillum rugosum]
MHELVVLLQGIVLGIAIAAPVGPIGLLCIRRTLQYGPAMGFFTGFGAAVADTIFGAIAAFGVSAALDFLQGHEVAFQLIGGIFLLVVAIRTFRKKPEEDEREADKAADTPSWLGGFMTGLSLTLTNPATIMAFIAIFAGFGLGGNLGRVDASTLVAGVFIGACTWWMSLSMGVAAVRHRISDERLTLLNHCTGVALAGFGLWALGMAFTGMAGWAMG